MQMKNVKTVLVFTQVLTGCGWIAGTLLHWKRQSRLSLQSTRLCDVASLRGVVLNEHCPDPLHCVPAGGAASGASLSLNASADQPISVDNDSMRKIVITRALPMVIFLIGCMEGFTPVVLAQGPTFDCAKASGSIEQMVCADPELGALDRTLSAVYSAALSKAANERPPVLKAEQRGWIKGRNDCWKADDKRACIVEAYRRRMAELQSRHRHVGDHAVSGILTGSLD